MEVPTLYTKVVLIENVVDAKLLPGKNLRLEIDQSYTIGKSIAVLLENHWSSIEITTYNIQEPEIPPKVTIKLPVDPR